MNLRTYKNHSYILLAVIVISVLSGLAIQKMLHQPWGMLFTATAFVSVVILLIHSFANYKCPKCKKYLGKNFVKYCTHCGCEISDETELGSSWHN